MADSRIFMLQNEVSVEKVANGVADFLRGKKNLKAEVLPTDQGFLVQAKQEDSWKKIVGMDSAIQIQLYKSGESQVMVNIGSGSWVDKAGAASIGMLVFAPLAVTAAIGAWNQKKLPDEIFSYIEQFIMSGGQNVSVSMTAQPKVSAEECVCPACKAVNVKGAKFCTSCGTGLQKECPHCHAQIELDTKFCPNCGENVEEKAQTECPECHEEVDKNAKFCQNCGHSFVK